MLREGGMVMLTVWEKHPDSLFQRMDRVLNTLSPGAAATGASTIRCSCYELPGLSLGPNSFTG